MRHFLICISLLALSACNLGPEFDNRGFGYVSYLTTERQPRLMLRKVGVIDGRPAAAVRFEGLYDGTLIDDMETVINPVTEITVRDDGAQMALWMVRVPPSTQSELRIYDVDSDREIFRMNAPEASGDAALACDLRSLQMESIRNRLRDRGIDPDVPFDLEFVAPPGTGATPAQMTPLGWTGDNEYAIELLAVVIAEISRGGTLLATLNIFQRDLYITYELGRRFPTCLTERPTIKENRRPYAESFIFQDPGRLPRILIDRQTLFRFPTDRLDGARHLLIPGNQISFVGPFR